jgi:hypothetical protein
MNWKPEEDPDFNAAEQMVELHVQSKTDCSICHR